MSVTTNSPPQTTEPSAGQESSAQWQVPESTPEKGRSWAPLLIAGFLVCLVAIAGYWVSQSAATKKSVVKLTHKIQRGDLVVSIVEQGTLESSENTEIKCRVRGFNTVIWVVEGGKVVKEGEVLVRLDIKTIEETVSTQKMNVHTAQATLERSKADVAKAIIAKEAYINENGRFRAQLQALQRSTVIAQARLNMAEEVLRQSELLYLRGYVNDFELEGNAFSVTQNELELRVKETEIEVLKKYTKDMQLATLEGNVIASKSKLEADQAGLKMDESRRDRALEELEQCVIKSPREGMVIYPSAAAWKNSPDIDEGATVRKDQILLLMPNLSKMQVKVGVHESVIDRVNKGLEAIVTLPDRELVAKVSSVASVTRPAGWWTGNVVKYDTTIQLPSDEGLKPGMSAGVEVILARHKDVVRIPVAAVIETEEDVSVCWVKNGDDLERRELELGDSNDVFIVVKSGVQEGEDVVLNPLAILEEAQKEVQKQQRKTVPVAPTSGNDKSKTVSGIFSRKESSNG